MRPAYTARPSGGAQATAARYACVGHFVLSVARALVYLLTDTTRTAYTERSTGGSHGWANLASSGPGMRPINDFRSANISASNGELNCPRRVSPQPIRHGTLDQFPETQRMRGTSTGLAGGGR
jgi:hypothetical protein